MAASAAALLHKHSFRPDCRTPKQGGGAVRRLTPHPSWIFAALCLLSCLALIRRNGSPSAMFLCPFTTGTFPLLDYEFIAGCVSRNHHVGRCLAMPILLGVYVWLLFNNWLIKYRSRSRTLQDYFYLRCALNKPKPIANLVTHDNSKA